jgi:hypothetical protein
MDEPEKSIVLVTITELFYGACPVQGEGIIDAPDGRWLWYFRARGSASLWVDRVNPVKGGWRFDFGDPENLGYPGYWEASYCEAITTNALAAFPQRGAPKSGWVNPDDDAADAEAQDIAVLAMLQSGGGHAGRK